MENIDKIYFLIHPVCFETSYVANGRQVPFGSNEPVFLACLEWERRVISKQKAFLANMKRNEALIILPIGNTKPMRDLEAYAKRILGRRCVIIRREPPGETQDYPVKKYLPEEIYAELAEEILETCYQRGYEWSAQTLKVLFTSRATAVDIQNEFQARGLTYDPQNVESEAFGEGFEQCAMTWKAMLSHYLGFAKPIENNFELSVTGFPFLINAKFKERIPFNYDIRLFLWEGSNGCPIALFTRSRCRLKDPQFFAHILIDSFPIEVWTLPFTKVWPSPESVQSVQMEGEHLKIAVYNAIRKHPADSPLYIIGRYLPFEEFRKRLVNVKFIVPHPPRYECPYCHYISKQSFPIEYHKENTGIRIFLCPNCRRQIAE